MKTNRLILYLLLAGAVSVPSCEPDRKMMVETGEASNVSVTTADVAGTVIDAGEGATQHGHCYSTAEGPTVSCTKTTLGVAAAGDFTSNLTGLQQATKYFVRAYTSLGSEVAYGSEISFTTASAAPPEITTTAVTSITKNSAVSGGNITSEGGTPVTARGVCWSITANPTTDNEKTTNSSGSGSFSSNITGLTSNTLYYVRAYATNSGGTAYGNEVTFTTRPEVVVVPTVTTALITSISTNSAVCGGEVTSDGGAAITAKGVCWSTSANPTITNSKTNEGAGVGSYVSNLTGLLPGTTYYIRAYATNSEGTSYGDEHSFTTNAIVPAVTTVPATSITTTSASSGGDVTNNGGSSVIARGVCWSTSQNPSIDGNHTSDGPGMGTFTSNITGLTGNTTYYIRAYATNGTGTGYGNELSFKTGPVIPTITTLEISGISSTTAISGGDIVSDGGTAITAKGVCWSTSLNPTTADSKTSDGTGADSFASTITGLTPGNTYHVRAYATNSTGTAYGADVTFTAGAVLPVLTTTTVTDITATAAISGGNITSDGGSAVTARGVCWSTSENPTTADSKTSDGTGTGSFISSITGLTSGAMYHVRAYATSSAGTAYGQDITFTAGSVPPVVTTTAISEITSTTASSGGNLTSDGGASVTARGVCWSASANPTTADSKTSDASGSSSYVSSITGLTPCTLYHVRAYATSSAGTGYGEDISFTTSTALVTVTTTAVSAITTTTASSGGSITGSCASTVTERGVCWSTTANPTTTDTKTSDGTGGGSYTSSITGLTSSTLYHVRAYATNPAGTAYGNEITFTAGAIPPAVTTTPISNVTTTSASSGGGVTSDGGSTVTARGICWSTNQDPAISDSHTNDGTGTGSFTSSIAGLSSNTTYYARAYATNSAGTAYGEPYIIKTATGTVNDADGNSYYTVTIGTQVWMMQNLKTTKFNDGTGIPLVTDNTAWSNLTTEGYSWYNNEETTYKNTYGALYNWYSVSSGKLCPTGWHVPSNDELTVLKNYLGGAEFGGKLKEAGTIHWSSPNAGATNESGFSALPGSSRKSDGTFFFPDYGFWWTSTVSDGTSAKDYELYHYSATLYWGDWNKGSGFSIRCLEGVITTIPTLTTTAITSVTSTTASSGGDIISDGGASVTARGVCWSTSANPTTADSKTSDGSGAGTFVSS